MASDCFLGIDIGTTHTKAVVLAEDGAMGEVLRVATPTRRHHGATFFDVPALERAVDGFLETVRARRRIRGVAFASVGESVVPVQDGRPLADALMWHDPATAPVERRLLPEVERELPRARRGCASNATFSLYKMVWMREALGLAEPEAWLPLSSYFVYRATRQARWDHSQASRSMLLDVPAGEWCGPLRERFGLGASLPALAPMGSLLGTDAQGTGYGLAGHDHITGLFCVQALLGRRPFVFDSIGSSEAVVTLTASREPFTAGEGTYVGAAFARDLFYVMRGIRLCGLLLEALARLGGARDVAAHYQAQNARLVAERDRLGAAFPILAGGDPVAGDGPHGFSLLNLPADVDPPALTHSAYLYLATVARMMIDGLWAYAGPEAMLLISGDATANDLYMKYRAAVAGRPLHVLRTREICGLGAALCAAAGLGARSTIEAFAERQVPALVEPDGDLRPDLRAQSDALLALYRAMPGRPLTESLA